MGDFLVVDMFAEASTRKPDAKGSCATRRRPRQALLSGLRRIIRHASPGLRTGMT